MRRCLLPAEARHQVDARRQKDSELRGAMPASALEFLFLARVRHQLAVRFYSLWRSPSDIWMAAMVQWSELQAGAYAKDEANAARQTAAGQMKRKRCLHVCSPWPLGARIARSL